MKPQITFEGISEKEILSLTKTELDELILCDKEIVFHLGSAEILGKFKILDKKLVLELAHIDGGGEGVLPAISILSTKIAKERELVAVEWIVHAVSCAKPNLKLRSLLEKKEFVVKTLPNVGEVFYKLVSLTA